MCSFSSFLSLPLRVTERLEVRVKKVCKNGDKTKDPTNKTIPPVANKISLKVFTPFKWHILFLPPAPHTMHDGRLCVCLATGGRTSSPVQSPVSGPAGGGVPLRGQGVPPVNPHPQPGQWARPTQNGGNSVENLRILTDIPNQSIFERIWTVNITLRSQKLLKVRKNILLDLVESDTNSFVTKKIQFPRISNDRQLFLAFVKKVSWSLPNSFDRFFCAKWFITFIGESHSL